MSKLQATQILADELKKETTHYMNRCILQYLLKRVEESDALAEEICQEHKSFARCMKYVYQAAYDKMALGLKDGRIDQSKCTKLDDGVVAYGDQLDDQFTYEAAEDYYHVDDYDEWKKEQEEKEKKKAEESKRKAKSNLSAKESAQKKAIKAMNDAAKELAKDPQSEDLAKKYAEAVEAVDKAKAELNEAKAECGDDAKEKPAKRGRRTIVGPTKANEAAPTKEAHSSDKSNDKPEDVTVEMAETKDEPANNVIPFKAEVTQEASEKDVVVEDAKEKIIVNDYSNSSLYVAFADLATYENNRATLEATINAHAGSNAVFAYISNPKGQKKLNLTVALSDELVEALKKSFGEKNVFCTKVEKKEVVATNPVFQMTV